MIKLNTVYLNYLMLLYSYYFLNFFNCFLLLISFFYFIFILKNIGLVMIIIFSNKFPISNNSLKIDSYI